MAQHNCILISGTPASGKDTLSELLVGEQGNFVHFRKHKASIAGKKEGNYIHISIDDFKNKILNNEFLQHHERYGNYYGIHKEALQTLIDSGKTPIVHIGKYENLAKILKQKIIIRPLSILFFVDRDETERRLYKRYLGNQLEIRKRVEAYDQEIEQLATILCKEHKLCFNIIFENNYPNIEEAKESLIEKIKQAPDNYLPHAVLEKYVTK